MRILLLLPLLLTGCVSGHITNADCSADFISLFKSAGSITLCGATVGKSNINTELLGDVVRALSPE